jgi:GAF domain-containing protein
VFHDLAALSSLVAPVQALDLAVSVLARMVPCEAVTAALYDINTDELRFVSVYGPGADAVQGKAVPRSSGLLGQALRDELRPSLFGDVLVESAFDPEVDGRPGLDARSMLLCPISNEGHLLGALQLINRTGSRVFGQGDASVLGYVAERLSEFLSVARSRQRSEPPSTSRA